jgi:hypothetical protein
MGEHDPHDERECPRCALLLSGCTCNKEPTPEQLESAREERLVRAEQRTRR